jgi:hypothetical protein
MNFVRDGNMFVEKRPDFFEFGIDPKHRCSRHDRHILPPLERGLPSPEIPELYQEILQNGGLQSTP